MRFKTFRKLYHIGTLDPVKKGSVYTHSQEGHGLSVSEVPAAWNQIARLGGNPWWMLTKPQNKFLHALLLTKKQRAEIGAWAVANGFAEAGTCWLLEYQDDESDYADDRRVEQYATQNEAWQEHPEMEGQEGVKLYETATWMGTEKLTQYVGFKPYPEFVESMLNVAYADLVLDIDGVFWNERLSPYEYSAPRAVILPKRLAEWSVAPVSESQVKKLTYFD